MSVLLWGLIAHRSPVIMAQKCRKFNTFFAVDFPRAGFYTDRDKQPQGRMVAMTKEELFAQMKGSIVVSCQATPGEPLYLKDDSIMYLMARAAKLAGARMIRTSSVRDIVAIKEETGLPVIGLIKRVFSTKLA